MAFVEFKDVRKIYTMGEVQVAAVDGMSFEIEQGELVVVVGPSGSGKTTLLNMMGGMDSCTSGSITLDGARVDQFDEKQLKTKSEKKVLAEAKAEAEAIRAAEVKKAEESDTETTVE